VGIGGVGSGVWHGLVEVNAAVFTTLLLANWSPTVMQIAIIGMSKSVVSWE
jgi:hypothetical protein